MQPIKESTPFTQFVPQIGITAANPGIPGVRQGIDHTLQMQATCNGARIQVYATADRVIKIQIGLELIISSQIKVGPPGNPIATQNTHILNGIARVNFKKYIFLLLLE